MTKKSINDRADTVDAVNGDDSNTSDITTLDVVLFFQPSKATYHSFFCRSVKHCFVGACHGFTKE